MDETVNRIIPYNAAAEQSVLGSVLMDRECIGSVIQYIRSDDFYDPRNKEMFEAVQDLFNLDKPIDVVTLAEQLRHRGTFEKIGGELYIADIVNSVSTSANVKYYAKIVSDYSLRRKLINVSNDISNLALEGNENIEKILDMSEQKIFDVSQSREVTGFKSVRDLLSVSFSHISERASSDEKYMGIPSGFDKLDEITSGFNKANLILVAARPSMGKTSFALNIAQYAALTKDMSVAIFSLEMSSEEIVNRIWFSEAMVESSKIREGKMESSDWNRLTTALSILSPAKIYIDDTSAVSPMDIKAKCRRLMAEKKLDMIIIDHIQLMQSSSRRTDNRQQEITEISRSLKMIAKDLDVPVIALSQLSRASESRSDKRPLLSDLRESGAIEQDADLVLMLYRDEYYNQLTEHPGEAEVIISKNRNGAVGKIFLKWQGEFTKFSNIDYQHEEV
ncbi:MAG: replicative DNA helicase [Clostridia bacterium]|nr:replicative DNA helicase [Clostridia bacterium]